MAATETASVYVNGLSLAEFQDLKTQLKKSIHYQKFLTKQPSRDIVTMAAFAIECTNCGVPQEFTINDLALHYLVKAIDNREQTNR